MPHCIVTVLLCVNQDIARADLLKPVGKQVQHDSPEVRMASAKVFGAMASEMGILSIGANSTSFQPRFNPVSTPF